MSDNPPTSVAQTPQASERFHGLDAARAAAMLLGVVYHLPIAMMGGFFGGPPSPKVAVDNWLHSFRMPLFFLISGFFAQMMLQRHGLRGYYKRRWQRIGAALFVSLALLVGYRYAAEQIRLVQAATAPAATGAGVGFPGMGFGPPPTGGSFGPGLGPPVGGFGTPPATSGSGLSGRGLTPPGSSTTTGAGLSPPTGAQPPFPVFQFPELPSRDWANKLFGAFTRHLGLEHLWFLWYLLVMVTVGPWVAGLGAKIGACLPTFTRERGERLLLRWNLAGLILGLASFPLLLHAKNFMGWSLANPHGFSGAFPDFLVQYCPDWPFYLWYFLVGWWLFSRRADLPFFEKNWKWAAALGVTCFCVSQWLAEKYATRPETEHYSGIRWGAFALYSIGSTYSAFGFLGFFQRHLNAPTPAVRYLADAALWIYLVHLPLIPHVMHWIEPMRNSWWVGTIGGVILVTGCCVAMYELIVLPTPLVYLYGPANASRSKRPVE